MAIDKKLIYCETKDQFKSLLAEGMFGDRSLVFVKNTGELWTHGIFFGGMYSGGDTNKIDLSIGGITKSISLSGHTHLWTDIKNTPTTISGYGITNAFSSNNTILPYDDVISSTANAGIASAGSYTVLHTGGMSSSHLLSFITVGLTATKYLQIWKSNYGLVGDLLYRASTDSALKTPWITLIDTNNSAVTKNGETLTVKFNRTSYSLTNTWIANTLNVAGYVAAPTAAHVNMVWKTDAAGNPGWRLDSTNSDTKNTTGATERLASKLFLVGALDQSANPQTYSNSKVYIGTNNKLYSNALEVSTTDHSHDYIKNIDSRNIISTPSEHGAGLFLDFKTNENANLNDGVSFAGLLSVNKYPDTSGGKTAQLGFTDNSNLWIRFGSRSSNTWESWQKVVTENSIAGKYLPLTGGTLTGNLKVSMNGVTASFGNPNATYTHFNTDAPAGFYFNKNVSINGDVFAGVNYSRKLAYIDEIYSQVGGTKVAQLVIASWNNTTINGGAIQIREWGNVTNTQTAWLYAPRLSFHWANRFIKAFGMRTDGQFAVDDVPISLSTHTHPYLPLSGGTMTGDIRTSANITTASGNGLVMNNDTNWTYLGQQLGTTYIRSGNTNLLHRKSEIAYTIWDASNDGPGSGMDADTLDGVHLSDIGIYKMNTVLAVGWNRIGSFAASSIGAADFTITNDYYNQASAYTRFSIQVQYGSKIFINKCSSNSLITKIRLVGEDGKIKYLEVFNSGSVLNPHTFIASNVVRFTFLTPTVSPETDPNAKWIIDIVNLQLTGNSDSTDKLKTVRNINATAFDGTTDITTNKWGTARTLSLTGAITGSVVMDGSGNVSLATTYQAANIGILDGRYLKLSGGTMTGTLNINGKINITAGGFITPLPTASRTAGVYGIYDPIKISHIWSIGESYRIADDGSTFGDLYGLACKHTNNTTGGTMAGGRQVVWCENGTPKAALGENGIWTNEIVKIDTPTGTAPIQVVSTTLCPNLNVSKLEGLNSSAFAKANQSPQVDLDTVNGFGIMGNASDAAATVERHYPIAQAGTLFYGTAAYSSANQIYGSYASNRWFARGGGGSSDAPKTAWKEFAFKTDNVASATKLLTTRTLWGKDFDGTADVSGGLTGVTNIYATGTISTSSSNAFKLTYGTIGAILHTDANNFCVLLTNVNDSSGSFNNYRPFTITKATGDTSIGNTLYTKYGGNVGIGTDNPAAKLHIVGNIYATTSIDVGPRVKLETGSLGFWNSTTGGNATGMFMKNFANTTTLQGIGFLTSAAATDYGSYSMYMGWGVSPYVSANNLSVGPNIFTYKNNNIWHAGIFDPNTKLNMSGGTLTGNLTAPAFIKSGGTAAQLLRADGSIATFNWSGQSGQPPWLWGGTVPHTYQLYNPSNFRVANAETLTGFTTTKSDAPTTLLDANNCVSNGLYYVSKNYPTEMVTADGGLYVQAYSDIWVAQIAQDYRNGNLATRGKNNGTWSTWNIVLNATNYTNYTVNKSGVGAIGTWGITISGNAATATKLVTKRTINGVGFDGTANIILPNILSGTAAPASTLGNNGDIYIQYV